MIHFDKISESYRLKFFYQGNLEERKVSVFDNLSLKINSGETVNLIGTNGCGKTTLLKIAAGIIVPQKGEVSVNGRVGVIMDIGCGFHPDLTARENITSSLALYEIDHKEEPFVIDYVREFSELGDYFDAPVRTYSQGMYLKMAFSFALAINPDILLIDDIIAVGDERARFRCLQKIDDLRESGKTVVLVTHDLKFAERFAGRTVWLRNGNVFEDGPSKDVILQYHKHFNIENHSGYSPLRFERGKESGTFLKFHRQNLMIMEELAITINHNNRSISGKSSVSQRSSSFIRLIYKFSECSFRIRCDCHLYEDKQIYLEIFLEDSRREISSNLEVEISFAETFLQQGEFPDEEYIECRRIRTVVGQYKEISYSGLFIFGANYYSGHNYRWTDGSLSLNIKPEGYSEIFRLLAFDLHMNSNDIKAKKPLVISGNVFSLVAVENSFRLHIMQQQLLEFEGVNVIFYYKGEKFSLSDSEERVVKIEDNAIGITHASKNWPLKIIIRAKLDDNNLSFSLKMEKIFPCEIDKSIAQFILHKDLIREYSDSVDQHLFLFESSSLKFALSGIAKSKLYKTDYREAKVITAFLPEEDCGAEGGFLLENISGFPEQQYVKYERWCFSEGVFNSPDNLFGGNMPAVIYMSFFYKGRWHDSSQAEWIEEDGNKTGIMPWMPLKLVIREMNLSAEFFSAEFDFIPLSDFMAERIQCCVSLDDQRSIFPAENSELVAINSLDNFKLNSNHTLHWHKKLEKMAAFKEITGKKSINCHLDYFSEGKTFKKNTYYQFCALQIKKER